MVPDEVPTAMTGVMMAWLLLSPDPYPAQALLTQQAEDT